MLTVQLFVINEGRGITTERYNHSTMYRLITYNFVNLQVFQLIYSSEGMTDNTEYPEVFSLTRSEQDSRSTFFHSIKKTEKAHRETKSDTRNLVKDTFLQNN